MTLDELRSLTQAKPFVPFVLHIEDGETVDVVRSTSPLIPPNGNTVIVYQMHRFNQEVVVLHVPRIRSFEFRPELSQVAVPIPRNSETWVGANNS
jgi:hypothetical protein